jgi:hypothetical protein
MVSSQPHDTHNNEGSKRRFGPLLTHATTKSPKYAAGHINLLSVIHKIEGLEIPTPGKSSPSEFC